MVYKAWENSLYIKKNNAYHVLNQDIYANNQYLTVVDILSAWLEDLCFRIKIRLIITLFQSHAHYSWN